MLTFEKVLEIFKDYLALDTELEVCKSRYGYIRVEFNEIGDILDYCSGVVCRTPEELFTYTRVYLTIVLGSLPAAFLYNF